MPVTYSHPQNGKNKVRNRYLPIVANLLTLIKSSVVTERIRWKRENAQKNVMSSDKF